METKEEKNKTYWDKERLEKFWGRNPTQEFNDIFEFIEHDQDDILILQEKEDLLTWIVNQFSDDN